jgi:hypothetical protein
MGILELEMERDRKRGATRYVTYFARLPEHRIDRAGMLELFIDTMNIPGVKSSFTGKGNEKLPQKIKVTVEWEDVNEAILKE